MGKQWSKKDDYRDQSMPQELQAKSDREAAKLTRFAAIHEKSRHERE
jgi:hypothetical protein